MDYYVDQYTQRGFHGGLNYYRTRRVNYEEELGLSRMINHPALMVTAGKDPAIPPRMAKDMPKYCSNLTMKHIQESGHWILIEQKEAVNSMLDEWLDGFEQKAKL
ncbi:epoxide hydrolase [Endogone sp. FLAS-F59071]|nr:epoxide hydrolase [Endogone sp. FLAS-F59071]|eukprot:RUS14271.1 epoxide hydrolase [Endogone sp. FLAS-F59071]